MRHVITGPRDTTQHGPRGEQVDGFLKSRPRSRHPGSPAIWARAGAWVAVLVWVGILSMFSEGIAL